MKNDAIDSRVLAANQTPPGIPPTIPAFSWVGMFSPLILAPISLPALAALAAPNNVLDIFPSGRLFIDWMQSMAPFSLNAHADSTDYPQVALLTHSLSLAVIAITTVIWTALSLWTYPHNLARRKALGKLPVKQHLSIMAGAPLVLCCVYAMAGIAGDPSFGHGLTIHSRVGLSLTTLSLDYVAAMILGVQLTGIRLFIDTHIKR